MRPAPDWPRAGRLGLLLLAVSALHALLAWQHWPARLGEGAASEPAVHRIEVAFVQTLQPSAPPVAALPRPRAVTAPAAAARPASAPEPAPEASTQADPPPAPEVLAQALAEPAPAPAPAPPEAPPAEPAAPVPALAAPADAPVAAPPAFAWPPSTRLSYTLTGDVRGPVEGRAQVEWLRSGSRYQVHLDIAVGPSFAPLMSRRITSEGELGAQGLEPRLYEEVTRMLWRTPRQLRIRLDPDQVQLANGHVLTRPPGVQDSASQFVQLTWLFTTRPELLREGQVIDLPLALPRRLVPWRYVVGATEVLATPAGEVPAVHVQPQVVRPGGDLTAEFWVAPSLQYLPVRMRIRQDEATFIELLIDQLPLQAAPGPEPPR